MLTRRLLACLVVALLWPWLLWAQPLPPSDLQIGSGNMPARTGSATLVNLGSADTGSTTLTIPADATALVIGMSGYEGAANVFTGDAKNVGLGGADFAGSTGPDIEVAFDASTSFMMGALWVWFNPPTGSVTLRWDWNGAPVLNEGAYIVYASYNALDTTGLRSSPGGTQQAGNPHTSNTLTAQSGDLIVAVCEQFTPSTGTGMTPSWSASAATMSGIAYGDLGNNNAAIALAESTAITGNGTVTCDWSSTADGGIGAIVFKPAAGGASVVTPRLLALLGVGA